jgi:hypothetical protein
MNGLARFGLGAGAALGGFNQAIDRQQQQEERAKRMSLLDYQINRQKRADEMADRDMDDAQAARQAAMTAIEEDRAEYEAQATKALPGPTLDGGAVARAPMQPYRPSQKALLRAAQAEYDELFRRGRYDLGAAKYVQAAALRTQFQQEAGMRAMQALQMGGDFITPFRELDEQMDDGLIGEIEEVRGRSGERNFKILQKSRFTGEPSGQPFTVTAQQMQDIISQRLADPKTLIKMNLESYLDARKAANDVRVNAEKEADRRKTNEQEFGLRRDLEKFKSNLTLGEIGARGAQDRKTNAAKQDGDADGGNVRTLTQANRAVETARNALQQARQAAIEIRLKTLDGDLMNGEERAKAVADDPEVRAANAEYQRALDVRNRLANGEKPGLSANMPPQPSVAPPQPSVARKDANRIRLDAQGNVIQ